MKKLIQLLNRTLILNMLFFFMLLAWTTLPVQADAGPKAEIILTIKNVPDEPFYVDLLVQNSEGTGSMLNLDDYDPELLSALKSQEKTGWYPALVNGTQFRLYGNIVTEINDGEARFTYTQSLPDRFKVILVTANSIVVSEPVEVNSFLTRIEMDAMTGALRSPNFLADTLLSFALMLITTLIVEGFLLWLFKLAARVNLNLFIWTNVATQTFLILTSAYVLYYFGFVAALLVILIDEWIIFITETIVYAKFLVHPSLKRKVIYAILANLASVSVGLFLMISVFA